MESSRQAYSFATIFIEGVTTMSHLLRFLAVLVIASFLSMLATNVANASMISWTTWTTATVGNTSGSAQGTANEVTVTYHGELESLFINDLSYFSTAFPNAPQYPSAGMLPSWEPLSSFIGGDVDNAPSETTGFIAIFGQTDSLNTVTFATPVANPVMAFWSLGASGGTNTGQGRNCLLPNLPGCTARFDFSASEPFSIESGGPSTEYGGGSVFTLSSYPYTLFGTEGNGVIQFRGTFSSLSWTNPDYEAYTGFTVGVPVSPSPVPEPSTFTSLGIGLIGFASWKIKRK
jgi:hypothetical protein